MRYATIVADPPWAYSDRRGPANPDPKTYGRINASASSHNRYGSMTMKELIALPVIKWSKQNAHLYLWTTNSFLKEAHELARSWGFVPKTVLTWGKVKTDGTASMKMGHYYRGATEHVLFCVRGKLKLKGQCRPTLYLSERLGHSVKPEWFYALVKEQSPGPRLEMFARQQRKGWNRWGNQA